MTYLSDCSTTVLQQYKCEKFLVRKNMISNTQRFASCSVNYKRSEILGTVKLLCTYNMWRK